MRQSDNELGDSRINQINTSTSRKRSNQLNQFSKNQKRDNRLIKQASGRRDIVIGANYLKAFQKFEKCEGNTHAMKEQDQGKSNASGYDLLVSYFCTVGMDEPDILHTTMSVKELEFTGYSLNHFQYDDLLANGSILSTDKPNNIKYLPQFQVPKFMPHVLTRVPLIDRSKLLFPINLADFVYPDGIHVISAQQVLASKKQHYEKMSVPQPVGPEAAFLDSLPIPPLGDKTYEEETFRYNSCIEKHFQLTNQENKNYSATCYEYFVDLKFLSDTFESKKRFSRYLKSKEIQDIQNKIQNIQNQISQKGKEKLIERQPSKIKSIEKEINRLLHEKKNKKQELDEVERIQQEIQKIIEVQIPKGRYFIPFSMVIVSQKPYRRQFQRILDAVYRNYTSGSLQNIGLSIEEVINRIVFGIRRPLKNLDYLNTVKNHKQIENLNSEIQKYFPKMITKVVLNLQESSDSNEKWDDIYFRNESVFDHQFSELSNICALLCRMPSENVLQIFKRLLFNKCTILQSDDHLTVEMAIKGIVQLFYPLFNGIVCVPQLPETNLEYVSLCNQAIIGVIKNKKKIQLTEKSISKQNIQELLQNFQIIQKNKHLTKKQFQAGSYLLKTDKVFQKVIDLLDDECLKENLKDCIESLSSFETNFRSVNSTRLSEKYNQINTQQNDEQDEIFDIMIDNSCFMALNNSHPTQKPKQSVCFNSMGKMIHGQGASQRVSQKQKANDNNKQQDPARYNLNRILAESDTLSDLELPRFHIKEIKYLILQLQQFQERQKSIMDIKMNDLKGYYLEAKTMYQNLKKSLKLDNNIKTQTQYSIDLKKYSILMRLIKKKQEEIHRSLFEVLSRIHQVKFRFFKMMQEIISAYTDENILKDFNKIRNSSKDQKSKLIEWRKKIQIFTLIDRKEFKIKFENNHDYKLHEKLIYFPSVQNFLVSKYFPVSQSENLRQIHILKKFEIKEKIEAKSKDQYLKNDQSKLYDNKLIEEKDVIYLFKKNNKRDKNHEEEKNCNNKMNQLEWADADYEEKCYFPHILSESELRKDFINNYQQEKIGISQEDYYNEFNYNKGLKSEVANVKDLSSQQNRFLMHQSLKTDMGISCLLLFIGTLDYNLDPYIFQSLNLSPFNIKNEQARFRPPAFYESQRHLQMILAEYLQSAMMFMIQNQNYDFNHRCPILALLYQNTHKYHFLHQTLLNIVNQEIDQLVTVATPASLPNASGSGGQGTMTVGSNFTVYQLHWQDKQLRLSQDNLEKYYKRQISHKKEIATQEYQVIKKAEEQKYEIKKRETLKQLEENSKKYSYNMFCPYTLNILNKDDWFYSEERLSHLKLLKKEMIAKQQSSEQQRIDINNLHKQIDALEQYYNQYSDETQTQKKNILSRINIFKKKNPQKIEQELKKEEYEVISDLSKKLSEINNDLKDGETRQENLEKLYDSNKSYAKNENDKDLFSKSDLNSEFFKPLSQRSRTFLSAKQIQDSVIKMKEGCMTDLFTDQNKLVLTTEQFQSVQMKLVLVPQLQCETCKIVKGEAELFDFVAGDRKNNQPNRRNEINPQDAKRNDAALRTFNCSTPDCDGFIKGKIHIKLIGTLGEVSVLHVPLYNPLYIRYNIELLLQIDNSYKVVNQIDISSFSQDGQPKELYWNAIFWFRYFGLPYQWLAPYSQHLNWYMAQSSVKENNHNLSEKPVKPPNLQINDSNPKKTMIEILLKKLKHDQKKKSSQQSSQTPGEEEMQFDSSQQDDSMIRDNQAQFDDAFALSFETNNQADKKVSEMTDEEKKNIKANFNSKFKIPKVCLYEKEQLAFKIYRERKENKQRKVNSSNNQN